VKKTKRRAGLQKSWEFEDYNEREGRGLFAEYGPMIVGGVLLVLAFAFAGHYMGQNAVAHNAEPGEVLDSMSAQSSNILAKGSLVPDAASLEVVAKTSFTSQVAYEMQSVDTDGKGDLVQRKTASVQTKQKIQIVPASVDLSEDDNQPAQRAVLAPPPSKVVQVFKLKRSTALASAKPQDAATQKAIAMRRVQLAEENCLARAVYFEARSESELGQLAVAKVILNRVKDPNYPKSICGVVYQGSGKRNSCQFSFACDGLPDDVKSAAAWANAKRIAQKAISGDAQVAAIGSATNYHADYVNPAWAKSMRRLIKIGHHVFYEDAT